MIADREIVSAVACKQFRALNAKAVLSSSEERPSAEHLTKNLTVAAISYKGLLCIRAQAEKSLIGVCTAQPHPVQDTRSAMMPSACKFCQFIRTVPLATFVTQATSQR